MKILSSILIISLLILSCTKSNICVKKGDLNINDLDETNMSYYTYTSGNKKIQIPHYFTPNNDGLNEILAPKIDSVSANNIEAFEFTIKNKCGTIFYSNSNKEGWGGSIDGSIAKDGKYNFELNFNWAGETSQHHTGKIELVL